MLLLEAEHHSKMRYRLAYDDLKAEQKKEIKAEMVCMFREEESFLLDYLPI